MSFNNIYLLLKSDEKKFELLGHFVFKNGPKNDDFLRSAVSAQESAQETPVIVSSDQNYVVLHLQVSKVLSFREVQKS